MENASTLIHMHAKCAFGMNYFCQLILPFNLFLPLFMDPTTLFGTFFMGLTILFQPTFTFIYNTFSKKISILEK